MRLGPFLRSPLTHFAVLGGLIFALFAVLDDTAAAPPPDAIVLTPQEAARLVDEFAATWRRAPTPQELDAIMQNWALEEAYMREALALGLDRGDAVIRQRLVMKMQFVADSGVAALVPDDATLQAYLDENPEAFERPASFTFEQVLLGQGADPASIEALRASLQAGTDPATVGAGALLPTRLPMMPAPVIDRTFGVGFGAALGALPAGEWAGPVDSGYGQHLVRVTDSAPARRPPLDEIRPQVEDAWRGETAREMRENFGKVLLDGYSVRLPAAAEVLAQ
jgi:hypothetical protein